jgi:hypothetical protein
MVPFVSLAGAVLIVIGVWGSAISLKRDRLRF